ncbi:hypothetical protein K503DRAFT_801884 [Rhizopogon vinicolor AM-OR11-026]|uniref:Uncharacterized protein n=1 Tax=Rhizopogon vinicolor AM-OR11-026 TaxID=1314800 RepID=A0A1B7MVJ2_9AGAM|nr:hypothetical protein K503DRAFT_801884 [Rhizopogon vinicolor AM-OR11-026]
MSSSTSTSPTPTDTPSGSSSSSTSANPFHDFITFFAFAFVLTAFGVCVARFTMICRARRVREARLEPWSQRDKGRRTLVPPVLWETWPSPLTSTQKAAGASPHEWKSIQPVSASFIRPHSSKAAHASAPAFDLSDSAMPANPSTRSLPNNSQSSSTESPAQSRPWFASHLAHPFNVSVWPWRRSRPLPDSAAPDMSEGKEVEIDNSPEAVKITVMVCMPHPAQPCQIDGEGSSSRPGRRDDALREYQIGVAQVPWTSSP